MIEEKYGTIDLLIMMLITSFIVGVINNLTSNNRLRGASDIVFMFVVLSSFVNLEAGKIPLTLVLIFIFYIVDEIVDLKENKKDNVSHIGHLIGAICGAVFGFLYMNGFSFTVFFSSLLK
jgi:membrane associated rhomboid family serine protease